MRGGERVWKDKAVQEEIINIGKKGNKLKMS